MRKSLTILLLFLSLIASATNYYVATPASGGSDSNPGTFAQPWGSWNYAFNSTSVQPGDTVFIRGGVYYTTVVNGTGIKVTRNGTSDNWIVYINYPGEKPVFDCSNQVQGDIQYTGLRNYGIVTDEVNYVKIYGLTVRNVNQFYTRNFAIGIELRNGYVILENFTAHNIEGTGIRSSHNGGNTGRFGTHYIINCDAYNVCDSIAPIGNVGNGFAVNNDYTTDGETYLTNCRAWHCADQGFNLATDAYVEAVGCWSFCNTETKSVGGGGGGMGWKMGWQNVESSILRRKVHNCIAAYNDGAGFFTNENGSGGSADWNAVRSEHYNNIAYHNCWVLPDYSWGFIIQDTREDDTIQQWRNFSNNISYDNKMDVFTAGGAAEYSGSNNSWDIPLTLTDADFESLDTTGITAPRQADGSLPDNDCYNKFLKLSDASQAINRGIDVGLDFEGDAPDLGPFEWTDYDAPPPLIATSYPTIVTSKRIVAGGYIIEDYDETIVWKGVCWNTTGTPTEADNIVYAGTGSDPFTVTISGLSANTTYYVRAYAITESGTGYGNIYTITTGKRTQLTFNGKPVVRGGIIQYIE
jgi:hypothetical protein